MCHSAVELKIIVLTIYTHLYFCFERIVQTVSVHYIYVFPPHCMEYVTLGQDASSNVEAVGISSSFTSLANFS